MARKANSITASENIEEGLAEVRADIANLTELLSSMGAEKVESVRETAKIKSKAALKNSNEVLDEVSARIEELSEKFEAQIKDKPMQSFAIAAAAGALLAYIARK